jgi:flagellin-like protein
MKTLRKIRKNAKALSPVVASIILIAVTVAVSIAVAAWMGALTVGFMGSSSLNINDVTFTSSTPGTNDQIILAVKNTGTKTVTIGSIKVNGVAVGTWQTDATDNSESLAAGDSFNVTLNQAWTAGNPYKFDLIDTSGQTDGSYQANSPGS